MYIIFQITIGRPSKYQDVDVNLKLEGPYWKISRHQATIRLCKNGVFKISCHGRKCLYVNGKKVLPGRPIQLIHNSVVKVNINIGVN